MAKSAAPFLSINPSGSIAGLLTASRWKGIPYLRLLVTPSNPRTADQVATRLILGKAAKAAALVLTSFKDSADVGSVFFTTARDAAPSGQSWISYLQRIAYNQDSGIAAAYSGMSGTIQGYFVSVGADLGLVNYAPSWGLGANYTTGQIAFILAYFASNYLTGAIKTAADTAIAAASESDVSDFFELVTLTTD